MDEKITLCGDDCLACPRYLANTDAELHAAAVLWHKAGWRDTVVANEEICCLGCSSHRTCTFGLVECTKAHGVEKCNQCENFPCEKITEMLRRTEEARARCRAVCTAEEYGILKKACFSKTDNLKK